MICTRCLCNFRPLRYPDAGCVRCPVCGGFFVAPINQSDDGPLWYYTKEPQWIVTQAPSGSSLRVGRPGVNT